MSAFYFSLDRPPTVLDPGDDSTVSDAGQGIGKKLKYESDSLFNGRSDERVVACE